jgi:hypothetical protein
MQMSQDFFLKNRLVVMYLARDLLATNLDERVQTVDEYVQQMKVSRGTVQRAMQFLVEQRCVVTHFRGHLGSYLIEKDNDKLWEYSGFGTLAGAMSLPLSRLLEGLATGICDCMKAKNISFNCVFAQGSGTRVNNLLQGKYDFIIASKLTERLVLKEHPDLQSVLELNGCTYCGRYLLLFADPEKNEIEDGMRISVDPSSLDQRYLTQLVCAGKSNIDFIETTYINTHAGVYQGKADVTVARADTMLIYGEEYSKAHARELKLPGKYTRKEINNFGAAVVLASAENYGIAKLLQEILRPCVVAHSQKQVMAGERVPGYY